MTFNRGGRQLVYRLIGSNTPVVDVDDDTETDLGDLFIEKRKGGIEVVAEDAASGAAHTIDLADGNVFDLTLTANCTLTLTGATADKGCSIWVLLRQDGTGSRTVIWPASVEWPGDVTPTLATAANAVDIFALLTIDGGTVWYGNYAAAGVVVADLDDLSDVTLTSADEGDILRYRSGVWRNEDGRFPIHVVGEAGAAGDGTRTVWNLANAADDDTVTAFVSGVMTPGFTQTVGDTITFSAAPAAAATIYFSYIAATS
jgi:hypothetical protein